jgi:hypothetical protein
VKGREKRKRKIKKTKKKKGNIAENLKEKRTEGKKAVQNK